MIFFIRFLTGFLVACSALMPAQAQNISAFASKAAQAILIDAKSGAVLYEKDADTAVPPASMSKLVTQAIVFDALKSGQLKLDQEFIVSQDAWKRGGASAGGSTMYAEVNSRIKVDDLIHAAIIQSANDACIVLAEGMAGSEQAFTQRMAAKAAELGLKNSTFANATGLPDPNHKMSVRDLAIVARYIINTHPEYYKIYGQPEFIWNKIKQQNRNPLLKDYPGADGMKTGYTKEAGYGLVGSATRDGRRLILVIAGLATASDRKVESLKLMDWGFSQFRVVNLYEAGATVSRARVWGGNQAWVSLMVRDAMKVALSAKEQENAEVKMSYNGPLIAPVKAGQVVGSVRMILDGKPITEVPLETAVDVPASPSMWSKAWDSLLIMAFGG
ncbi:MAG: D-alanyl-D-alanine carboxypeptidase [Alphaproteobacteria bacterium]|nr:D-alanyl-D-alanine carboxypeptidase [Alphaproteobacteria bacterium]